MTLTAMRPDLGLPNGREASLFRVADASELISALDDFAGLGFEGVHAVHLHTEQRVLTVALPEPSELLKRQPP